MARMEVLCSFLHNDAEFLWFCSPGRQKLKSEPSTPERITMARHNTYNHQMKSFACLTSPTKHTHLETDDVLWLPASAPPSPSLRLHRQSELQGTYSVHECTFYDKMSWCFTAQMLDAIHAHLPNPLLRPITLRYAAKLTGNLQHNALRAAWLLQYLV